MHVQELFSLKGKTAMVTGGGRGLGEQIAVAFAEAGANVVVCSRKLETCRETAEKLRDNNVESLALACDVTNPEDVERVVAETKERFGQIDILVNNSGASWGAPALDMPLDKWEKVMNVNATGTFLMSKTVGKEMKRQKSGKIINMASVAGLGGAPSDVLDAIGYSASKGAIISFTKDLAVKLAPNINVNAIAPGFFPTKMSKGVLAVNGENILSGTPMSRFGEDNDIKGAALFLATPASDYVSGHILVVDGGAQAR
ncbi:MAG TPA: SDR family oxidoreductase [Bacillales bacterium]|nr:SDR family oxidoreductase [Bacillales bacterium]